MVRKVPTGEGLPAGCGLKRVVQLASVQRAMGAVDEQVLAFSQRFVEPGTLYPRRQSPEAPTNNAARTAESAFFVKI